MKIPKPESKTVEFKSTFNQDVIVSLVAFANADGGNVYVGVRDDGKVVGVQLAAEQYAEMLREKYGFPVAIGGKTRTESLANGLEFIANNYECKKVIVANAVCPFMTEEQLDRYFGLLDEHDYVLTSWKVVSTLHRYDGECVDRTHISTALRKRLYLLGVA